MFSYRRDTALQGALQFSPKVEDWNCETIFYGHYRSIFNYCDIIGLKICRIPWKTQNRGYYGVRRSRSFKVIEVGTNRKPVCDFLLITNRKSHTGFRLVPTSITLNDLERRNSPYFSFFYPAACNADAVLWGDFCPSVRLSVRLSVTRVDCDKTVERSVQIYIPYERTFILVFWEDRMVGGGDPFYLKFWVNLPPLERNRRFSTNNHS